MKKIIILMFLSICINQHRAKAQIDTLALDALMYQAYELQFEDADSSELLARQLLAQSERFAYQKGKAAACMRLGSLFQLKGQNDSAIYYTKLAYQIRCANAWYAGAIDAANQLNISYQSAAQPDSSFWVLYDALKLAQAINDSLGFAYLYYNLAYAHLDFGDVDTSFQYLQKALKLGELLNDPTLRRMCYSGLGDWYYRKNNFQEALHYFLQTDALTGDEMHLASARSYNNIAACYDQLGDFHQAKAFYRKALQLHQKLGSVNDEALSLNSLGALFFGEKIMDSARYYFQAANQLLDGELNRVLKVQNLLELSETEAALGNYQSALDFFREHNAWRDSLLEADKVASIAEMQTIYDTERKQKQIELLNALHQQRLAERRFLIAGLSFLFLVSLVLVVFLRLRQQLNRRNQELAQERIQGLMQKQEAQALEAMLQGQEEERQRIAMDLHDRLGALLSTAKLMVDEDSKVAQQIDDSVRELRRVSHNLSTGHLESFGLVSALQDLSAQITAHTQIKCDFQVYDWQERLDRALEVDLYRISQEAINNALKYSGASEITVQIYRRPKELSLSIEDNGRGFNPKDKAKQGIGLNNIKLRLEKWQGQFNLDSSPGRGTLYIIEIPLDED